MATWFACQLELDPKVPCLGQFGRYDEPEHNGKNRKQLRQREGHEAGDRRQSAEERNGECRTDRGDSRSQQPLAWLTAEHRPVGPQDEHGRPIHCSQAEDHRRLASMSGCN